LYSKVIWQLYGQGKQVYLTLDRSEWKMRGKWVQVTMIGIAHQGAGKIMNGGQGGTDLLRQFLGAGGEFLNCARGASQMGIHKRGQIVLPDSTCHRRHKERKLGADGRGEGTENQELRLEPGAGLRMPRRADPPAFSLRIKEEGRVEVCRIIRGGAHCSRAQPGDCRGCHSCQFDRFSSHASTVD